MKFSKKIPLGQKYFDRGSKCCSSNCLCQVKTIYVSDKIKYPFVEKNNTGRVSYALEGHLLVRSEQEKGVQKGTKSEHCKL